MSKIIKYALFSIITCFSFISCRHDKNTDIDEPEQPVSINRSDLYGTWMIEGNSNLVALILFENASASYNNKRYDGSYTIVEFTISGTSYKFKGQYEGGFDYSENGYIEIGWPEYYHPLLTVNSLKMNDEIDEVPMIYPNFTITELKNNTMRVRINGKDFVGNKNLEYTNPNSAQGTDRKISVDLGLSVNWAKCNIGADKAEEFGGYFGWGDISGKKTSTDYDQYPCSIDKLPNTIINTQYDIAKAGWGSPWRMPSYAEIQELVIGCISETVTYNNIKGRKISGITGESIFLPSAGYRDGTEIEQVGYSSRYWSGNLYPYNNDLAWGMFSGNQGGWYCSRYIGCSVRAVVDK